MDSTFIPLYLNSILLSNLFTVANLNLDSDVSIQSISTKTHQNTTYTVPISELTRDFTGRYIQGDVKFDISTELQLQQTAIEITALIKLKRVLVRRRLIRPILSPLDIRNVRDKEYIEFQAIVYHNPHLKYIEKMIDYIETDNLIDGIKSIDSFEDEGKLDMQMKKVNLKKQLLGDLKDKIKQYRQERCEYLITEGLYGSGVRVIIPVEDKHLLDNIEHMIACRVTVLGKVIKIGTLGEFGLADRGMNYLDHVDDRLLNEIFNKERSRFADRIEEEDEEFLDPDEPVILVLPLSISM